MKTFPTYLLCCLLVFMIFPLSAADLYITNLPQTDSTLQEENKGAMVFVEPHTLRSWEKKQPHEVFVIDAGYFLQGVSTDAAQTRLQDLTALDMAVVGDTLGRIGADNSMILRSTVKMNLDGLPFSLMVLDDYAALVSQSYESNRITIGFTHSGEQDAVRALENVNAIQNSSLDLLVCAREDIAKPSIRQFGSGLLVLMPSPSAVVLKITVMNNPYSVKVFTLDNTYMQQYR
ncbi:MAG: hypothetical protein ACQ5SW_09685 [Sphaerochaetaceae bacterium]